MPDIDDLIELVIAALARHPDERRRTREILDLQGKLQAERAKATKLLLDLEQQINARDALAIEVALRVGLRAGKADAYAAHLDDETAELVANVAVVGLNLSKLSRLQAMAEVLRLELADADDVFDR